MLSCSMNHGGIMVLIYYYALIIFIAAGYNYT